MPKHTFITILSCSTLLLTTGVFAEVATMDHGKMDHSKHMMQMTANSTVKTSEVVIPTAATAKFPTKPVSQPMGMGSTPLKEAGNAIFGTIQEAIKMLDANPNTDWSKVDLEGLRQHLIDMENFTSGVDVLSQRDTDKGFQVVIRAKSEAAHHSLKRALEAHPSMLTSETGWSMTVDQIKERFMLTIETEKPSEIARLRALGYIGIMALGNHHQVHHWLMASGSNPHGAHAQH